MHYERAPSWFGRCVVLLRVHSLRRCGMVTCTRRAGDELAFIALPDRVLVYFRGATAPLFHHRLGVEDKAIAGVGGSSRTVHQPTATAAAAVAHASRSNSAAQLPRS